MYLAFFGAKMTKIDIQNPNHFFIFWCKTYKTWVSAGQAFRDEFRMLFLVGLKCRLFFILIPDKDLCLPRSELSFFLGGLLEAEMSLKSFSWPVIGHLFLTLTFWIKIVIHFCLGMIGVSLGFCFGVDIAVGGLKSWTTESDPVNNEAKFRRDLPSCQKTNEKQKNHLWFYLWPQFLDVWCWN